MAPTLNPRMRLRYLLTGLQAGILGLASTGCAVRESPPAAVEVPAAWSRPPTTALATPTDAWYRAFGNTELDGLIARAELASPGLAAASARLLQANARARAAGAALMPEVAADGSITTYAGHSAAGSGHETDWAAVLTATYELDFWGRNRAAARSAQRARAASVADAETVRLATRAAVAGAYFQLLSIRERVRLAESDVATLQEILQATEARAGAGLTGAVEVATQRAVIANAEAAIPLLREQESEALGALAILVGAAPEGFSVQGQSLDAVTEPSVGAGLPASLLRQRPDLVSAEANLRAAAADVAVARAALLPDVALTVTGGLQNPAVQAAVLTLNGSGPTLTAGAALVQSVFDHGRRRAQRDLSLAREQELLATYREAVLAALLDVENALSTRAHLDEQRAQLAIALAESQRAVDGALARYRAGSSDHLTMLEARRALLVAQDQMSQHRLQRLQAAISLCRALGGGWNAATVSPPSVPPGT